METSNCHAAPLIRIDLRANPLLSTLRKFADRGSSNETTCSRRTFVSSNPPTVETPRIGGEWGSVRNELQVEAKSNLQAILQRSYLMYNVIQGKNHKLFHILTQPLQDCSLCSDSESLNLIMQRNMRRRYVTTRRQYELKAINDIITSEHTNLVAVFRDFLILDDTDEYLKRPYTLPESGDRIPKAFARLCRSAKQLPNHEATGWEKRLMRRYVGETRQLALLAAQREARRLGRVFDTQFVNSVRASGKESARLSKVLDAFLAKDSQLLAEAEKPLGDKSKLEEHKEVPKAELRLERNLAIKLGFATDRDDVCIIPIEEIRKVQATSGAASPRNEILLTAKSRSKYSATLQIQSQFPHAKRNSSTSNKKKPKKMSKAGGVKNTKVGSKTRNVSRKRPSEVLTNTAGKSTQKTKSAQKCQALIKMRTSTNHKQAQKENVKKKPCKHERTEKTKSQCNVLDLLNKKVKKNFINVLQKKNEVLNIQVKESPSKRKSLISCRSVSNLNKRKSNTKILAPVSTRKHNFD